MKNLLIYSRDAKVYANLVGKYPQLIASELASTEADKADTQANLVRLIYAGQNPTSEALSAANVVLGEPDLIAKIISTYPNIEWVQSTWAGNNKLQEIGYNNYTLTACKGIFGQQMLEYVLAYILYFERNIARFNQLKTEKTWLQLPCNSLQDKTLGILGLGSIAHDIVAPLQMLGLSIIGLANSPKNLPELKQYSLSSLHEFAGQCDYVLNLLPETEHTKGLCDAAFFAALPSHCVFINAGRGSIVDSPDTLINALNKKQLRFAVIDVFTEEPLPESHPYYDCEEIMITCHTAAVSDPIKVFNVFINNLQRYLSQKPLLHIHDFTKGY